MPNERTSSVDVFPFKAFRNAIIPLVADMAVGLWVLEATVPRWELTKLSNSDSSHFLEDTVMYCA